MAIKISKLSMRRRALSASSFVAASHVIGQALRLGSNLVLTRLLAPEMFGVMALATVVIVGVTMVSDIGVRQYVIKKYDGESIEILDTAWVIQIARGLMLCLSVLCLAFLLYLAQSAGMTATGSVYSHADLPYILGVLALVPAINGFQSTRQYVLSRNLLVARLEIIDLASQLIGIVIMLSLAWHLRTIWPLVIGGVAAPLARTILSHSLVPGVPHKFSWNTDSARSIFGFTKWIFLSSILGFIAANSDKLWFARLMSPEQLGIYSIAFNLAFMIKTLVDRISGSVVLPVLSAVDRTQPLELMRSYYRIRCLIDPILMFACGILFSMGPLIVGVLYDDRYEGAGSMLSILSLSIIGVSFLQGQRYLVSKGLLKERAWIELTQALSVTLLIPLFYYYFGVSGALYAVALSPIAASLFLFLVLRKHKMLSLWKEVRFLPLVVFGVLLGDFLGRAVAKVFS